MRNKKIPAKTNATTKATRGKRDHPCFGAIFQYAEYSCRSFRPRHKPTEKPKLRILPRMKNAHAFAIAPKIIATTKSKTIIAPCKTGIIDPSGYILINPLPTTFLKTR